MTGAFLRESAYIIGGNGRMRKLLITQGILVAVVAALFLVQSPQALVSALYGGSIALLNSILLGKRVARDRAAVAQSANMDLLSLYFGALQRFALTIVAMAVGMGWLKLDPIALLVAFGVAQLGYVIAAGSSAGAGKNNWKE